MTKISVKLDNALVDEIENDRKNKGLKISNWMANALNSYLHPPHISPDQLVQNEELKKISNELRTSQAEKETLTVKLAELEGGYANLKSDRDKLATELANQKKEFDTVNTKQELFLAELTRLEKKCQTFLDDKETIRTELAQLQSKYDLLKGEKEAIGSDLTQLRSTCDRLQGERDQAVADRNRFLSERENLEKQLLEMAVEIERSKAKTIMIDELRKDKDFLQVEYRKLSDHMVPQLPPGRPSFWSWIWGEK